MKHTIFLPEKRTVFIDVVSSFIFFFIGLEPLLCILLSIPAQLEKSKLTWTLVQGQPLTENLCIALKAQCAFPNQDQVINNNVVFLSH